MYMVLSFYDFLSILVDEWQNYNSGCVFLKYILCESKYKQEDTMRTFYFTHGKVKNTRRQVKNNSQQS